MDELELTQPFYSFIELLSESNSLIIIQIPNDNYDYCVFDKNWSITRIMVSILANYNESLFFEQLKLIAKNDLKLRFDESKVRYKLDRDKRVTKQKDGSYKYNNVLEEKSEFLPLLDEIEEFFINNPKILHINELFSIVEKQSENPIPNSKDDLLALITVDNRFEVLNGEMIGII